MHQALHAFMQHTDQPKAQWRRVQFPKFPKGRKGCNSQKTLTEAHAVPFLNRATRTGSWGWRESTVRIEGAFSVGSYYPPKSLTCGSLTKIQIPWHYLHEMVPSWIEWCLSKNSCPPGASECDFIWKWGSLQMCLVKMSL